MNRSILISIIFILFTIPALAGQYPVTKVVDGDTIDVIYQGKKERIRMLCVDTPESVHPDRSKNTPMGEAASRYTKSRLTGEEVDLEFEAKKRGKYGRLLAYVILDGENFNVELVEKGWSPYYTKYGGSERHHSEFMAAEQSAKDQKLNIWSTAASGEDTGNFPVIGTQFHGNVKSHKFHNSGCRHYNCKNCVKVFNTRQDALNAGYKPCGICKP